MKKIIVVILIILAVFGTVLNAKTDQQVRDGAPISDEYLKCTGCLQTVSWIAFSLISGFTLLFDPEPMATWLGKIWTKRNNKFAVRFLGFFLLAQIFLSGYELSNNCQTFCNLLPK